jgi:hypothetical protein
MRQPELIVDLKLYPTSEGGRRGPIGGSRYGCPCMLSKDSLAGRDGWVLPEGRWIAPGERARVGMIFLSPDSAALFRAAGKFYLWEGGIIGEATVVG